VVVYAVRRAFIPSSRIYSMSDVLGACFGGTLLVLAAILFIPALILVLIYNSLVSKRNQVENAFATVDVLLKKRYDLIPNLVATVKGYMEHERGVLTEVTDLRAKAVSPGISSDDKVDVDNQLTAALRRLMVSVENYPDLKASGNFMHLQTTLTEVEEQISAGRRAYNASVLEYNNAVEMFPTNILASAMSFRRKRFFEIAAEEKAVPEAPKTFNRK